MDSSQIGYPRPDWVPRNLQWQSLDGPWSFRLDYDNAGIELGWQHKHWQQHGEKPEMMINVPYVFQYPAAGLKDAIEPDARDANVVWYQREFEPPHCDGSNRLLLRFGAVDYEATVWVNSSLAGSHRGGHVPFDIDITDQVAKGSKGNNWVTVRAFDAIRDTTQPRGKQSWHDKPEAIWYTPSSGIWQTVWLEHVPLVRIGDSSQGTVFRSDDIQEGILRAKIAIIGPRSPDARFAVAISAQFAEVELGEVSRADVEPSRGNVELDLRMALSELAWQDLPASYTDSGKAGAWAGRVATWSPEHPLLYAMTIRLLKLEDGGITKSNVVHEVTTQVGMRSLEWSRGDGTLRLNRKPYFQALVLDQGYWPSSGITPPTEDTEKQDIIIAKAMGFNGCRKHQVVSSPTFLYWADRLGFLVWSEIANAQDFDDTAAINFAQEWLDVVRLGINHPSIVVWTPVNESWGYHDLTNNTQQRSHIRSLYHATKSLDPTRPINDNCGWEHVVTDLSTFHEYSDGSKLAEICKTKKGIFEPKAGRKVFLDPILPNEQNPAGDQGSEHRPGAPILCTEFGGVNIAPKTGTSAANSSDWGYTTVDDPEHLLAMFEELVMGVINGGHCCGFVYTQLCDIEQEVNGLYTPDRVPKLDVGKVRSILEKARETYSKSHT